MVHNHISKVEGIRNLLKTDYNFDGDEIDIDNEVDDSLTFNENWFALKTKLISLGLIADDSELNKQLIERGIRK